MPPLLHIISALSSSLFRFFSYVFLRIIPARWNKVLLPTLYIAYLVPAYFASSAEVPVKQEQEGEKSKDEKSASREPVPSSVSLHATDALWNILFSFPSSKWSKWINFVINATLLLADADFALRPLFDTASDVAFARLGAVYPEAAKIVVRYPQDNATATEESHSVRIVWRRVSFMPSVPIERWSDGPVLTFSPDHDWTNTTKLRNLWPGTEYEYTVVDEDESPLAFVSKPRRFRTFPDPRLPGGSHFRFIVSSCVIPNFPYRPFQGRTIKGFDLLADFLASKNPKSIEEEPIVESPANEGDDDLSAMDQEQDDTTQLDSNSTKPRASFLEVMDEVRTEFMLFLGDFIYADVPVYFGEDKEAYRRLYRRNYNSPSFRRVYEQLPIFHTYDDHEILDNFAGQADDTLSPFPGASDAFRIYNAEANYDPVKEGQHYYDFTYGDSAFFVMDTRRYRSDIKQESETSRTMLGDQQLAALYEWLARANDTAVFKFIVSSVPFTSLWTHDAQIDSWAAFELEKTALLNTLHTVPNVILLSGDRHEFAAIEFNSERQDGHRVLEFSTSPMSMFYIPFIRTLRMQSEATVQRKYSDSSSIGEDGLPVEVEVEIPQERVLKYLPLGNHKWSSIEIDTQDEDKPTLNLEVWIDGASAYTLSIVGKPVSIKTTTAVGTIIPEALKEMFNKVGFVSDWWF